MIKRKISFGLITFLILVFACSFSALASTDRHYLEELDMYIEIPDDGYLSTRDINDDDPMLDWIGHSKEEEINYLESYDIYLQYINLDPYYELDIKMFEYEESQYLYNFNLYSEAKLAEFAQHSIDDPDSNYSGYEPYTHGDIKYIILDDWYIFDGETNYRKQYNTIYNGQQIYITLTAFGSPVTNNMAAELKSFVDSIEFTKTLTPPQFAQDLSTEKASPTSNNSPSVLLWVLLGAIIVIAALVFIVIRNSKRAKKNDVYIHEQDNFTPQNESADNSLDAPTHEKNDSMDNDD